MIKLNGIGINPLFATGSAKIVVTKNFKKIEQMAKDSEGKVIIVPCASPEYFIFLCNNCAGIISDTGSHGAHLTSHMYHYNKALLPKYTVVFG